MYSLREKEKEGIFSPLQLFPDRWRHGQVTLFLFSTYTYHHRFIQYILCLRNKENERKFAKRTEHGASPLLPSPTPQSPVESPEKERVRRRIASPPKIPEGNPTAPRHPPPGDISIRPLSIRCIAREEPGLRCGTTLPTTQVWIFAGGREHPNGRRLMCKKRPRTSGMFMK